MKKHLPAIMILLLAAYILTGCGGETIDIAAATIRAAVDEALAPETLPIMMELDASVLKTYYELGDAEVREFSGQMPLLNVSATEIVIIHAKKNKADIVLQALSARRDALLEHWSSGGEAQYTLVQDCRVVQNGEWLLLVIAEPAEEIVNAFNVCIDSYKS